MTGYQEVVTDPSFAEQIVRLTAPMVGTTASMLPGRSRAAARAGGAHARGRGPAGRTGSASTASWRFSRILTRRSSSWRSATPGRRPRWRSAGESSVDESVAAVREQPRMAGRALAARACHRVSRTVHARRRRRRGRRLCGVLHPAAPRCGGRRVTVYLHDADAGTLAAHVRRCPPNGSWPPEPRYEQLQFATCSGRCRARHLPRSPAAPRRSRPPHLQAALRPPRREPSGADRAAGRAP